MGLGASETRLACWDHREPCCGLWMYHGFLDECTSLEQVGQGRGALFRSVVEPSLTSECQVSGSVL